MLGNDRDLAALWDMAEAIREILDDTRGLSLAEFQQRRVILRAVVFYYNTPDSFENSWLKP